MPEPSRDESDTLAIRILAGEEKAYLDFQLAYRRLFLAFFLSLRIPSYESEDLTANVITDVLARKIRLWKPEVGGFHGWVVAVARNAGLQWLRKVENTQTVPLGDFDTPEQSGNARDVSREAAVHEALAKLSSSDRAIIELREFDQDRPYAEVAGRLSDILGRPVTEQAARVRHTRALQRLRELLVADHRIRLRQLNTLQGDEYERDQRRQTG